LEILILLQQRLEATHAGLKIVTAIGIRDGLRLYALQDFNLFMIAMPPEDTNVHNLLTFIRKATPIPIVLIATFEDSKEIARAYYSGADICLTDPMDIDIMAAVLTAQYRRLTHLSHMEDTQNIPLTIREDLVIHPKNHTVTRQGEEIKLTAKEFDLLYYMARNADKTLTQAQIFEQVWKSGGAFNSDLTSRISRLRNKIEPNPKEPTYIKTIRGRGYKFCS